MLLEAAALATALLTLACWFAGWPAGLPAAVPLLATLALAAARAWPHRRAWRWPRPHAETVLCLGLGLLYRASALVHPWGWVNRDGAYGAYVALHLLQGQRPAPVFTEGANYQGTLKAHLAALLGLLSGHEDLSRLMAAASLGLSLAAVAAAMALARRLAGRPAALATGLYLALGPRFPTVFSLNCVGQYVDVLALGGVALALAARLLAEEQGGRAARGSYLAIGALLGAAFWQQPVALSYAVAALLPLLLRRRTWRDPFALLVPAGLLLGLLPVLLWNAQHGWATAEVLEREPGALRAHAERLPVAVARTVSVSFPILAGLSPGHPLAGLPGARAAAAAVIPLCLLAYLLLRGREAAASLRRGRPSAALLAPLLLLACLGLFWMAAAGRVLWRPRYLLPVVAATAVHLGVLVAWLWARSHAAAVVVVVPLLALHVSGFAPRVAEAARAQRYFEGLVRGIVDTGIRTGYADFSIAAPVTMFTAERVLLSPRLGPTPAYYSPVQEARVRAEGPDAFVLRPRDDVEGFAAALRGLGVDYRLDPEPVPVFHRLSRKVPVEVALAAWGRRGEAEAAPE